jgi:FkbM family methyltransferase
MQKLSYNLFMIIGFYQYCEKYDFSNVRGIVHVGAHYGGEYQEYVDFFGSNTTIHWFEPQKDVFDVLMSNLETKPNNYFYNYGLGSINEVKQIWTEKENKGESASFSKPKKHLEQYPNINFFESDYFEIKKLDEFNIQDSNVLVLDVQGFEMEVLKGSTETLKNIDHIFCEINSIEMYEGCPTLSELCEFLYQHGFTLREDYWTDGSWGDGYWSR